jgi:hypothetical protein
MVQVFVAGMSSMDLTLECWGAEPIDGTQAQEIEQL